MFFVVYHLVPFLLQEVVLFYRFTYLYLLEVYPTTTVQQLEREIMSIPKCIGIEMLIPVGFKVFIWLEDCIKLQLFTT